MLSRWTKLPPFQISKAIALTRIATITKSRRAPTSEWRAERAGDDANFFPHHAA
jgi:hypothetical protein